MWYCCYLSKVLATEKELSEVGEVFHALYLLDWAVAWPDFGNLLERNIAFGYLAELVHLLPLSVGHQILPSFLTGADPGVGFESGAVVQQRWIF